MTVTPSLKTLLDGAIDYAGLFPPAGVDMATAMRNYAGYVAGPRSWALGRLVVPVSALEDFNFHIAEIETAGREQLLKLSAIVGDDLEACVERVGRFNRWHAGRDGRVRAVVETIEVKAAFTDTVSRVAEAAQGLAGVVYEIPIERDPGDLVSAIVRAGGAVKVRTGGVSPRMVPRAESLVRCLEVCLRAGLRFKATGGLRHPLSGSRSKALGTSASEGTGGPTAYGFLNLFLCAAFLYDGLEPAEAVGILREESSSAFAFDDEGVEWRGRRVASGTLAGVRRDFAASFGSASFEEPLDRLRELELT